MTTSKPNQLSRLWIILRKEITDNLRDRRTLTTMAISIIVGPLLLFAFLWFAEKTIKDETDLVNAPATELPVAGADYAPNLIVWLKQNNINVIEPPADINQAISNGQHRVILVIEESFPESFKRGATAPLRLVYDSSITGLEQISFHTVHNAIQSYGTQIGSLRLLSRGISPETVKPIHINVSDVATPQARNAQILTMLPYLIIIFIMVGGMYLAIDTTAGEREKGSLEPLLTQPIKRSTILLAKLGATIVFSAITFLLILVGLALAFNYMPIDSISLSVGLQQILKIFVTCLPFVFLASALMVLVASFTKSYKEAQSYISMIMLVPSLPLIILGLLSPEPNVNNMWVPSLSHGLIIIETLKGESIPAALIGLSMLSTTIFALILAWIAIKLYQRERILG